MWKEAQQEVRQHWFIDCYISAYIQVQYRVTGVHPTVLTVDQGCRQMSTVSLLLVVLVQYGSSAEKGSGLKINHIGSKSARPRMLRILRIRIRSAAVKGQLMVVLVR